MAGSVLTFVIVGHEDHPIFEADLTNRVVNPENRDERSQYLHQFVLHAALDAVDEQMWQTPVMHLSAVDKFHNLTVSAFVTAAHIKFMLLHDGRSEDSVRSFFREVYELYLRVLMNPFFSPTLRITSPNFAKKVRELSKQCFRT